MLTLKCPNQSLGPRLLLPFHKGPVLLCIIALGGLPRQLLQNLLSSFVSPPMQTLTQICSPPGFRDFQNLICFSFIHPYITLCSGIFFVPDVVLGFWDRDRAQQSRHGLHFLEFSVKSQYDPSERERPSTSCKAGRKLEETNICKVKPFSSKMGNVCVCVSQSVMSDSLRLPGL